MSGFDPRGRLRRLLKRLADRSLTEALAIPLSPSLQGLAARMIDLSEGAAVRRVIKQLIDQPQHRFDAAKLAQEKPTRRHRRRPPGDPFRRREDKAPVLDGPLGGGGVVAKESFDIAGLAQTLGAGETGSRATRDAELIRRARAAGGRILGHGIMTELGMDGLGCIVPGEVPQNPCAAGYLPGGSSTGTAVAVARGLARFGLGGDGLGSIRIPSGFCGLVGLKPTRDLLPTDGYRMDSPSLDVPGPMTKTVADCALLWQVLAGEEPRELKSRAPRRIGLVKQLHPTLAAPVVQKALRESLERLGGELVELEIPGADAASALAFACAAVECARSDFARQARAPLARLVIAMGRALASEHDWLEQKRRELGAATARAFERCDVIAAPTTAVPAPAMSRSRLRGAQQLTLLTALAYTTPLANLTGTPGIAVPCGKDAAGRPLSTMLLGPAKSETALLQAARVLHP